MANQLMLPVLLLGLIGAVTPQSSGPLYPINGTVSISNGYWWDHFKISLKQPFVYFGRSYNQIYMKSDGYLILDSPWYWSSVQMFPARESKDIIAPFWTDFDDSVNGVVYYNQYTSGSVLQQATRDIQEYFPELNFTASWVFVVTWNVAPDDETTGTETTVQAVLISGGQDSFVLMNYGTIASRTQSVQAGYDTIGSTHYFSIPGSFSDSATGSNSTFHLSSNVNVPGRWAFQVNDGPLGSTYNEPLYPVTEPVSYHPLSGSYHEVILEQPFVYFGRSYNPIYMSRNGNLIFTSPMYWSSHQKTTERSSRDIIAPFGTDFNSNTNGVMFYNQYTSGSVLQQATRDIQEYFPELNFTASWVFIATWYVAPDDETTGTETTVQAVLISGGQDSFVLMNYGKIASRNQTVQAGYDTIGSSHYFLIPGSFSDSATGSNSTFRSSSNVNVPGRWAFQVNDGSRGSMYDEPLYQFVGTPSYNELMNGYYSYLLLEQPFVYFGRSYNRINVYDGYLSFVPRWYGYTPKMFPARGPSDILTPFWTYFDNNVIGIVFFNQYTSGSVLQQATRDIQEYFPELNFTASWVFVATWYVAPDDETTETFTTVQAVLISGGQYSFVMMNYGSVASTTENVQAGYDTIGSSHYFSIPGSFSDTATGSNSTFRLGSNVNVPGRWAFRVDDGPLGSTYRKPLYPVIGEPTYRPLNGYLFPIALKQPFGFFGRSYHQIYVNHNGHLTFMPSLHMTTPRMFPAHGYKDIIAPFWTDLDDARGVVFFNQYTSGSVLQQATKDIQEYFQELNFTASWVFVATWYVALYYPTNETYTTVQAVLISGGQDSFVLMNYGKIASRNQTVQAGYDTIGSSHYFLIPGSFSDSATGSNSTFRSSSNVNVPGRWAFQVDDGSLSCTFTENFYPINGETSSRHVGGSSPSVALEQPFVYFGRSYDQIHVSHNGYLTFDGSYYQYIPYMIPAHESRDIIAPFWTDLDHGENGVMFYNQYTSGCVLQQATSDIQEYFPELNFTASWVFVVTWHVVPYYLTNETQTTVQAVLISGGQDSFVLMNYGTIASRTQSVQAGYDTIGSSHYFSIPGSFSDSATGSNSTFRSSSNVNVPGRWAFQVDDGTPRCTFNGEPVQQGDSFWSDSSCAQMCTCTSAGLQCHSQPCSFSQICRPAAFQFSCQTVQRQTCTISGDPHYSTFDGTLFHFQGTCTYVLSEQCGLELPYFRVEGTNENRGSTHVSWTRLVKVLVNDESIELVKGHHGEAKVNGSFAATPLSLSNGTIQVYESGFSVVVSTDFGLEVSYDANHYVRISLPYTYQNATCGLCGNFNSHPEDDFLTRHGEIVTSDVVFANSWEVSGENDGGCGVQCEGLDCASCTADQTALYSNADHCGILQNSSGAFAACHLQLPPQNFVENCVYDLCVAGGYQPILCQALNVYAHQCQQKGVQLPSWRRRGFCEISCPSNSHYEPQGSGCPATCVNPKSTHNCPLPPQESCVCDSGYILSAGVCVPHAECGCSFEGRYYRSGETVILDQDCGRRCTCSSGSMTCHRYSCGPLESCSVEEGQRGCRPNSYETCWIRGPGYYHTFDGVTYHYPGACRLTLAKVMGLSSHPHFMVAAEKVPRGHQGFSRVLKFEAEGTHVSIEMTGTSKVKVDGQLIRPPYSSASNRIHIYHSSIHSIILRTSFGVTVQTVWPHFVRVTAPGIYNGSIGGLCGNYNTDPNDDFQTPSGILVDSAQVFGDSWRDGSLVAHCVETVSQNSTTNYKFSVYCGILDALDGPFDRCWAMEDPQQHVEACDEIIRASADPESSLCKVLRDYALMCQIRGNTMGHWRNVTGCEQSCPPNSHYEICGSSCPSTCPSLSFPFSCGTLCQEGCQCDDGFVLNGDQCVPPTACGCYHQGRYRQGGEQFWDGEECQSFCTCDGTTGAVHCVPNTCGPQESCRVVEDEFGCHPNPHGSCSASGDPHYLTFDGKAYDFQGTCRYILAAPCNTTDGLQQFSVEAKNEAWHGSAVSITAEVFVNVWGYQVHMSRERHGVVQVNGVNKNTPILLGGGLVSIYASGSRTFVSADFGLVVKYDGWSTVSISVPSNYSGQMCGLCGNFNGNASDEYQTPSGMTVTSPSDFGTAWKVAGNYTCSDGCGSSCPQCIDELPAQAQCEVIQGADGPLSFCHEQVDPSPYFNDCVYDVCVTGNGGQDLLCRAVEAYVSACQSANVRIYPWRQNTTCRLDCPENSHYELCGTDCGHTCASSVDATCEQVCSEGCFCDEGFLRSGTRCVPVERCGCQFDGFYYDAGESFWTDGCSQQCECHAPNDLRCSSASCTPAQECTIKNGQLGCFGTMSTCTVWGDPHYVSFDGALAHFQGTCSYIVTESVSHGTNETQFQVVATNNHRGNNRVSFVSAVDIYLSNELENTHIWIGPNKVVKVNDTKVSLPTTAGTLAQVLRQGSYIVVDAIDIVVQFDGQSTLLVKIGQNHENRVTGMCGNFNSDCTDDKVLPNGTLAQDDNEFGDSWKAPTSLPGCGSTDDRTDDGSNNCPLLEQYSELCGIITNSSGPFSSCHQHTDPQLFFTSCVYDLCLYSLANGMLCSAVSAYESTCSGLGLNVPEWRSALQCAESDPCEHLDCTEYEWCGEKHGVYGCFCDERHHRTNNESYDSFISCEGSSGTISVSRCQLFEAGFPSSSLHLQDESCNGTLQDGRLVFHFNNNSQLCGTVLMSNGTHFMYKNTIQNEKDPGEGLISRHSSIHLSFSCEYSLTEAVSMDVGINSVESVVKKHLPSGQGQYNIRMMPYQDSGFNSPLTSVNNMEMELDQRLYIKVWTEGVDDSEIATVLDSCWATPVNIANHPVRWNLISEGCANPKDDTVEMIQNGVSSVARFSFRMFTFTDQSSIYLHCSVHYCLSSHNNCSPQCHPGSNGRRRRAVSYHDSAALSLGPLALTLRSPGDSEMRAVP